MLLFHKDLKWDSVKPSKSKNEFINQEKHRRGVVELDAKIRKIEAAKDQFLKSFDYEESKQNRKRRHRDIWLKERGVA